MMVMMWFGIFLMMNDLMVPMTSMFSKNMASILPKLALRFIRVARLPRSLRCVRHCESRVQRFDFIFIKETLSRLSEGLWLMAPSLLTNTLRAQRFFANDQAQCEDYLLENDFSRSGDDPSVWKPAVGEFLSSHRSLLNQKVAALFNLMPTAGFALNFSISQILICINTGLMRQIPTGELAAAMNQKSNDLISKAQLRALPDDDPIMMFINDLFPYDYYRSLRSDLQHLENRELLFHYWDFGRFEGVSLSEQGLQNHLQASVDAKLKAFSARIEELEGLLASVRAHQKDALFQLIHNKEMADRDR